MLVAMNAVAEAESTKTVQRFVCVFDEHVSAETTGFSRTDPLHLQFIVRGDGSAYAVGRNIYPAEWRLGYSGVTFVEVLKTGAVQTTTIDHQGESCAQPPHHPSGELVPSQYYGTCK